MYVTYGLDKAEEHRLLDQGSLYSPPLTSALAQRAAPTNPPLIPSSTRMNSTFCGYLLVMGELGINQPPDEQESILKTSGQTPDSKQHSFDLSWLPVERQLRISPMADLAINVQHAGAGIAIHIIRYDYNFEKD